MKVSTQDKESRQNRKHDGAVTQYLREGRRLRRQQQVRAGEDADVLAPEIKVLHAAYKAELSRTIPRLKAKLLSDKNADLDMIERTTRDNMMRCGAKGYAVMLEKVDADLPPQSCPNCDQRMDRDGRTGITIQTRIGPVKFERTYYRCRKCGDGYFPLDCALGLDGENFTPGARSMLEDAADSESCEEARR